MSSRCEESQEDLGNLRWGLGEVFGRIHVSGVRRMRKLRVMVAMVMEMHDSLLSRTCMCLSMS